MNKYKALGIGSNIGERAKNLRRAILLLKNSGIQVTKESSVYETEPVDCKDKDWFLNQVIFIETDLTPRECFKICKKIEAKMGRQHSYRNSPRIIDIDLLLWRETILNDKDLIIPHKSIRERKFVLIPLLEIAGNLKILEWLIYAIQGQEVKKYEEN